MYYGITKFAGSASILYIIILIYHRIQGSQGIARVGKSNVAMLRVTVTIGLIVYEPQSDLSNSLSLGKCNVFH